MIDDSGAGVSRGSLALGAGAPADGEPLTVGPRSVAGAVTAGASPPAGGAEAGTAASLALGGATGAGVSPPAGGVDEAAAGLPLVGDCGAVETASSDAQLPLDPFRVRAASEAPGRSSLTRPRTSRGMRSLFAV